MSKRASYVIFARHGHRAPNKNIFGETKGKTKNLLGEADVAYWKNALPDFHVLHDLSQRYPVVQYHGNDTPIDMLNSPYGCITNKGVKFMKDVGKSLRKRFPFLKEYTQIDAYSTNYQRTNISAQCILSGLDIIEEIDVQVRLPQKDPLNFFDGDVRVASEMMKIVKDVHSSTRYLALEEKMKDTAEILLKHLPAVGKMSGKGVDWPTAYDFFVCRRTHDATVIPMELVGMESDIRAFMSQRYGLYFSHPRHMKVFTVPILKEAINCLSLQVDEDDIDRDEITIRVNCCHDITMLSLLHTLQAKVAYSGMPNLDGLSELYWPEFGDTIVLEAIHTPDGQVTVNFFLNNIPLEVSLKTIEHAVEASELDKNVRNNGSASTSSTSHLVMSSELKFSCTSNLKELQRHVLIVENVT